MHPPHSTFIGKNKKKGISNFFLKQSNLFTPFIYLFFFYRKIIEEFEKAPRLRFLCKRINIAIYCFSYNRNEKLN